MTVYPLCAQAKYRELPGPFNLKAEPNVPYSLQILIVPSYLPLDKEQDYVDIFKHIYLHKNKVSSADCVSFCHGAPVRFDWGKNSRLALAGLNNMLDRTGGMQIRIWTLAPKFAKKQTLDQSAREAGYRFIREHGPRSNNMNQFMEWTDEQVHCPGGPLEGWQEGKVKEALHNYYRGRQNAKAIQYWPLTLKSFVAWFLDEILVKVLPTMRQHAITWIGRTVSENLWGPKPFCLRNPSLKSHRQNVMTSCLPLSPPNTSTFSRLNPSPNSNRACSMTGCCNVWTHLFSKPFWIHQRPGSIWWHV